MLRTRYAKETQPRTHLLLLLPPLRRRLVTSFSPAKYTSLFNTFKSGATTKNCDKNPCNVINFDPGQWAAPENPSDVTRTPITSREPQWRHKNPNNVTCYLTRVLWETSRKSVVLRLCLSWWNTWRQNPDLCFLSVSSSFSFHPRLLMLFLSIFLHSRSLHVCVRVCGQSRLRDEKATSRIMFQLFHNLTSIRIFCEVSIYFRHCKKPSFAWPSEYIIKISSEEREDKIISKVSPSVFHFSGSIKW